MMETMRGGPPCRTEVNQCNHCLNASMVRQSQANSPYGKTAQQYHKNKVF